MGLLMHYMSANIDLQDVAVAGTARPLPQGQRREKEMERKTHGGVEIKVVDV